MSAAELMHVGTVLASAPYSCAFLSWRYQPEFDRRPDVRAALDSVAAARGGSRGEIVSATRFDDHRARAGLKAASAVQARLRRVRSTSKIISAVWAGCVTIGRWPVASSR